MYMYILTFTYTVYYLPEGPSFEVFCFADAGAEGKLSERLFGVRKRKREASSSSSFYSNSREASNVERYLQQSTKAQVIWGELKEGS